MTLRLTCAVAAGALLAVASGCGGSSSSSGASTNSAGNAKKQAVVVAWNSTPDVSYLPLLMAVGTLQKQGYNIKTQTLSGADVAAQALASNRAQFTSDNITGAASAVDHGAAIKIVAAGSANEAVWVTSSGYKDCNSLTGKPVGIFGPAAASGYTKEMDAYFAKKCPNVKPKLITIPDSSLRAQALANHQIDATVLALSDAENLTTKLDPSGKYTITSFRDVFPGLADNYLYANGNVLKDNPTIVTAFVQAEMQAVRQIYANPSTFASLLKTNLSTKAYTADSAKASLDSKTWYANGGLDATGKSGLTETLKVFKLPGTADALIDSGPVDKALTKIGRSKATTR